MTRIKSILDVDIFIGKFDSINSLKNVNTTNSSIYPQFSKSYVINYGQYYLDRNSSLLESLPNIITPNTGQGRWIFIGGLNSYNTLSILSNTIQKTDGGYIQGNLLVPDGIDSTSGGILYVGYQNANNIIIGNNINTVEIKGSLTIDNLKTIIPITNGGTGQTSGSAAFNALSPTTNLGDLIYRNNTTNTKLSGNISINKTFLSQTGDGTNSNIPVWNTLTTSDIPNLDSSKITSGTIPLIHGGTGQTSGNAAFNSLSPTTTKGDLIYRDNITNTRLPGNISTNKTFLTQTGDGTNSNAPIWNSLNSNDIPNLDTSKITSGTIPLIHGGTGQTSGNAAFNSLSPTTTKGDLIYRDINTNNRLPGNINTTNKFLSQSGDGTNSNIPIWNSLNSNDIPNLDASKITSGIIPLIHGGTGKTSGSAAFDALSPTTNLGDLIYRDINTNSKLSGNISINKTFLSQTGDGTNSNIPVWNSLNSNDIPNLDASKITSGIIPIIHGGTGMTSGSAAFDALSPTTTKGDLIYRDINTNNRLPGNINTTNKFLSQSGDGTNSNIPIWNSLNSNDIPNLDASKITSGIIPIIHGGTGQTSGSAAFDVLSPTTNLGDLIYKDINTNKRLPGNTSNNKYFLSQSGDGTNSNIPIWNSLSSSDIPNLDASKITSGIIPLIYGGTGSSTTSGARINLGLNIGSDIPNFYDNRFNSSNIINVKKNPGYNEFLTIEDALNSITTNSSINSFIIKVGVGIFMENQLNMKPYVSVMGSSIQDTIIMPNGNNHLFVFTDVFSELSFISLQNVPLGYSAIFVNDSGNYTLCHKVNFVNCDTNVKVISLTIDTYFYGEYIDFNGIYTYGIFIESNGHIAYGNAENYYNFPTDATICHNRVSGDKASLDILASGNIGYNNEICILSENGALVTVSSTYIQDVDTGIKTSNGGNIIASSITLINNTLGIYSENSGTNSNIQISGCQFLNCTANINIDNITTYGSFNGFTDHVKTTIIKDSGFFITNKDANIITVAKKGGDYTSVKAAVDSVIDATVNNTYTVEIGPGIFIEDTIVMKQFVYISGYNTTIQVDAPNKNVIIGAPNSTLFKVTLYGSTDVGTALLVYNGGGEFTVDSVSFQSGYHFCQIGSSDGISLCLITRCYGDVLYQFGAETCFVVADNGVNFLQLGIENFIQSSIGINEYVNFIEAHGSLSSIILNQVTSAKFGGNGVGINVYDGVDIHINACSFQGFDTFLKSTNTGSGPKIRLLSSSSIFSTSYDIKIDNPFTTGTLNGAFQRSKVSIDNSVIDLSILYTDPIDQGTVSLGKFYIGNTVSSLIDVSDLIINGPASGVYSGGNLYASTSGSNFTITLESGYGYLMAGLHEAKKIEWNTQDFVLPPNSSNYLYFNSNDILSTSSSQPNTKNNILLGRIVTDFNNIEIIDFTPVDADHMGNNIDNFNRQALGAIYDTGSIVTDNGTNSLTINVSSGVYYFSSNKYTTNSYNNILFKTYFRNGNSGFISGTSSLVDNSHYDSNSTSGLTLIPSNKYVRHTLYIVGSSPNTKYLFVYGQTIYDTQIQAEEGNIPTPPTYFTDGIVLIASIIIQEGNPSIVQIRDERPVIGFKASGVSASAVHGNLLGLLADDHPQYLLTNGGRTLTNNLNIGGNNIINVNLVDGVDISTHSSRHLPNGADPLITAAPNTNLNGNGTNSIGIANSLSRSDHGHAIDIASSSITGLLNKNDWSTFNNKFSTSGGTIYGNLSVTGTVNGRNISTDGSTLDTLNSGFENRVLNTNLTNFQSTTGIINSSDNILISLEKSQGNITLLQGTDGFLKYYIDQKVNTLNGTDGFLQNQINSNNSSIVSLQGTDGYLNYLINQQVNRLDGSDGNLQNQINSNSSNITSLYSTAGLLQYEINSINNSITNLNGTDGFQQFQLNSLYSTAGLLQYEINTINSSIVSLQGTDGFLNYLINQQVSRLDGSDGNLQSQINTVNNSITSLQGTNGLLQYEINSINNSITNLNSTDGFLKYYIDQKVNTLNGTDGFHQFQLNSLYSTAGLLQYEINSINNSITSLQGTDGYLNYLINQQVSRLDGSDGNLQNQINSNNFLISSLQGTDGFLNYLINQQVSRLDGSDGNLQSQINSNSSNITSLYSTAGLLQYEINSNNSSIVSLQGTDGFLKYYIDQQVNRLDGSDGNLQNQINSNSSNITSLYSTAGLLQYEINSINNSITNLNSTDGFLKYYIDQKVNTLSGTDGFLKYYIDQQVNRLDGSDGNLQNQINFNSSNITSLYSTAGLLQYEINTNNSSIVSLQGTDGFLKYYIDQKVNTLNGTDGNLQSQINSNNSSIVSLQGTDGFLKYYIDQKVNTLNGTDGFLQNQINTNNSSIVSLQGTDGYLNYLINQQVSRLDGSDGNLQNQINNNSTNINSLYSTAGLLQYEINNINNSIVSLQGTDGFLKYYTDQRINSLVTGVSSVFGRVGGISASSGDYNTLLVTENTNLYFTNSRAINSTLTSYASTTGTVSATDSLLIGLQKVDGNDKTRATDSLVVHLAGKETISGDKSFTGTNGFSIITLLDSSYKTAISTSSNTLNIASGFNNINIPQLASTSGSPTGLLFTGGLHTTLTASTELTDINFNLNRIVQFAAGSITTQRAVRIQAPTYSFVGASTITDAATLSISGSPTAGTNATILRPYTLWIPSGNSRFDGNITSRGVNTSLGTEDLFSLTLQTNSVGRVVYSSIGSQTHNMSAQTSGNSPMYIINGAAHTNQTLSTELTDINFNLNRTVQFASGNITTQRAVRIQAPTYSFVGASTITTAATLSISGSPTAGTNATITNRFGLYVESGNTALLGQALITDGSIATPNSSAIVDLVTTSKGFGLPSMTSTQRNAITSPRDGLLVYDNDTPTLIYARINGSWNPLISNSHNMEWTVANINQGNTGTLLTNIGAGNMITIPFSGTINQVSVIATSGNFSTVNSNMVFDIREVTLDSTGLASDVTSASGTSRRTITLGAGGQIGARFERTWVDNTLSGTVTSGNALLVALSTSVANVTITKLVVKISIIY